MHNQSIFCVDAGMRYGFCRQRSGRDQPEVIIIARESPEQEERRMASSDGLRFLASRGCAATAGKNASTSAAVTSTGCWVVTSWLLDAPTFSACLLEQGDRLQG